MSTNATIEVEDTSAAVYLYKHWDGNTEATLPWLESFNRKFNEDRGYDPDYKLAQLIRSSVRDADEFDLDKSDTTGWGVIPATPQNQQPFHYLLKSDGSVTVK